MSTDNPKPKPTIDERLDAVIQTLELVAAMQRDNDQRFADNAKRFDKRFAEITEGLARLLHIAEIHEHRISKLEGDPQ